MSRTAIIPLRVSIIIPMLNEEQRIGTALAQLLALRDVHEVIVVDGGSVDRSVEVAKQFDGVEWLSAPRGRASQMNAGANRATGEVLLFLHADVSLPADAIAHVHKALAEAAVVAGAFRTWTVADGRAPHWAPLLHLADVRSRYTSLPYGDQALFVRTSVFKALGGFAPLALMEDLELSQRLRRLGRIQTVSGSVTVSGRRFIAHPLRSALIMTLFPLLFRVGVSPKWLATLYGHVR